ncbi:MAG: ribosomal protein S18-alanine N-acetyltransferase [Archaeoglobaceae archaeon]
MKSLVLDCGLWQSNLCKFMFYSTYKCLESELSMSTTYKKQGSEGDHKPPKIIEVRPCREDNLDEIYGIEWLNFPFPWSPFALRDYLRSGMGNFLVATDGNEILGYAIATVEKQINQRIIERGHLLKIVVRKEHRRKGVGSSLLRALVRNMEQNGVEEILLEVRVENPQARALYQKFGFKDREYLENFYLNGDDALLMTKKL